MPDARCPVCGKTLSDAASRTRPFCSRRCAEIDLGRWFTGQYRVPTAEPDPEDDGDLTT